MSFHSGRALDGYALASSNNAFVTSWLDIHSSPFFSISVVFSSSSAAGTLTLESSNDREATWTDGTIYPMSARFVGGPIGDPIDKSTVVGSSQTVSGVGPYTWSTSIAGYRFVRVKYVPSSSASGTVTVTWSRKSSS